MKMFFREKFYSLNAPIRGDFSLAKLRNAVTPASEKASQ
jgi:hypothetical protein